MAAPLVLEIDFADGSRLERPFDADELVVGRSDEADVALPRAPELEPAHVLLVRRARGVWVSTAREARVRPLHQGRIFDNDLLPYGAELDVGSVTVRVRRAKTGARWPRLPIALCVALACGALWIASDDGHGLPGAPAQPPELLPPAPDTCPEPARAADRTAEALAAADARELRYPYDAQQGLTALRELHVASVCARAAGRDAAPADERRRALEARVLGDYKAATLALERARRTRDSARVLTAARALRAYVAQAPGAYRDWLAMLERHAATQVEKASKKKP